MIRVEKKIKMSIEQFCKYWNKNSQNWELTLFQKMRCKKEIAKIAKSKGLKPQEIVEMLLNTDNVLSIKQTCKIFQCDLHQAEQILIMCGYQLKPQLEYFVLEEKRKNDILRTCDAMEAYENKYSEINEFYNIPTWLTKKKLQFLFNFYYIIKKNIEKAHLSLQDNVCRVDPANGERNQKLLKMLYVFIVIFLFVGTLFGVIFIGSSINKEVSSSTSGLSWVEVNGFWGALLGSLMTGCATVITTYLIITKDYKMDYHRERMSVLPAFSIQQVLHKEEIINDNGELCKNLNFPAENFISVCQSEHHYDMRLFRVKNVGHGIAFSVTFIDNGIEFYDFSIGEEKYLYLNIRMINIILLNYMDIYENSYVQRFELRPIVDENHLRYRVKTYVPELYLRTKRARYQQ